MTDEKMLELARQAGLGGRPVGAGDGDTYVAQPATPTQLRKFAALARREALLEVADLLGDKWFATQNEVELTIRALAAQEGNK